MLCNKICKILRKYSEYTIKKIEIFQSPDSLVLLAIGDRATRSIGARKKKFFIKFFLLHIQNICTILSMFCCETYIKITFYIYEQSTKITKSWIEQPSRSCKFCYAYISRFCIEVQKRTTDLDASRTFCTLLHHQLFFHRKPKISREAMTILSEDCEDCEDCREDDLYIFVLSGKFLLF